MDETPIERWWAEGEVGADGVFVRRVGDGPVVTFLHGWPTSSFDFHLVEPPLRGRATLLHVDNPGSGASAKPDRAYPIAGQADVIEAVWAAQGVERTVVVAHDYGTIVAQELLARRREGTAVGGPAITGVVWLNGSVYPQHYRPTDLQVALADPEVGPQLAPAIDHDAFAAGFPALFGPETQPSAELVADLWRGISRGDGHHRWPQVLGYMAERAGSAERYVAALDASVEELPTRFVWGQHDPVSGAPIVDELARRHPGAVVDALEGIGHYPQLERPDAVAAAIASLLDEVGRDERTGVISGPG